MRKRVVIGTVAVAAAAAGVLIWRRSGSGYDDDEIDSAMAGGEFGERGAPAPEQKMAPAETRTDITPERLSMAARLGESADGIRRAWPSVTQDDIDAADGDLEKLTATITTRSGELHDQVRRRLDEVIARETPDPSYPAH